METGMIDERKTNEEWLQFLLSGPIIIAYRLKSCFTRHYGHYADAWLLSQTIQRVNIVSNEQKHEFVKDDDRISEFDDKSALWCQDPYFAS